MTEHPKGDEPLALEETERERAPSSLAAALRTARLEQAERSQAHADLRQAELARLDLLRELLEPALREIPPEIDLFDAGVMPGDHPRLFVDMIAFVEMGHDRRTYRFVQDRRHGRVVLAEAEGVGVMVRAVTAYIARRLVERERLLASLGQGPEPAGILAAPVALPAPSRVPQPRRPLAAAGRALHLVVDGLGVATLGAILWLGFHFAQGRLPRW